MNNISYSQLSAIRMKLGNEIPLDTPYSIYIDPTNFCNFHCSFCPRNLNEFNKYAGEYKHMDLDLFRKIISEISLFQKRIKAIKLYYIGEPLLHPNFMEMFSTVCESDCCDRIEISTNGSLLTRDKTIEFLEIAKKFNGTIYLRVSVYAIEQKHFFDVTANKMDVKRVYENIEQFYSLRNHDNVSNVFIYAKKLRTMNNEDELFLNAYQPITDEVALEEPMNWSGDGGGEDFLLKKEYSNIDLKKLHNNAQCPNVCSYLFTTMAIQSDGSVVACCVDWSRKTQYGNVNKNTLQEIWNGERLKHLRMLHLKGLKSEIDSCRQCKRIPLDKRDYLDDISNEIIERL